MMSDFRADIHMHSTFSDGSFTPLELLSLAKDATLSGISITDHDTIGAYSDSFFLEAEKKQIAILTGVEISSSFNGENVHILGYGFDHQDEEFNDFLMEIRKRREDRNLEIIKKLNSLGFGIDVSDIKQKDLASIGRPHIAQILIEKQIVANFQTAFNKYLKTGQAAFVPLDGFDPIRVIERIHKAEGKAIIAHPHFAPFTMIRALFEMPFDGLEAYYAKLYPNQEAKWVKMAEDKGWIATGGSDFHGKHKPQIPIGASWVDKKVFEKLSHA